MKFKIKILLFLIKLKLTKFLFKNNIKLLQKIRLQKTFKNLKKSDFYKTYMQKKDSLTSLPIINKAIFMQHFDEINTCKIKLSDALKVAEKAENSRDFEPMINNITIGLSTGTSGNRGVFLADENERALWVACILDRVIGFSFKKRKVAFFLRANSNLYQSTQSKILEFNFFDIFKNVNEHINNLNIIKPQIIVAQPSMLCILAEKQKSGELNIKPQKIISVAEVLSDEDKSFLEFIFKQTIHQVYQCTEGFLAATCTNGILHFNEDFLIIEKKYINTEKTKYHPIITDLFRKTQPVIRYELNDIITEKNDCSCKNKMTAIDSIEGRSDDILTFINENKDKISFFPDIFRRTIVLADESITDYCLIQTDFCSLKLYIKSELENSYNKAIQSITNLLNENKIFLFTFEKIINDPFVLGTKKRRIKNDNRKTN